MVSIPLTNVEVTNERRSLGPFEVLGELGEGGSGKVYAVTREGKSLALKVLRDDLALSERERRRFLEEAERMRRVEHTAIVRLVDSGTLEDGRPYLVMPLLEGETLAARLARGRLEVPVALRNFAELADAVTSIHRAGLIHRDIKPENVILCVDAPGGIERPVLLDLGIARDADASSSTTTEQGNVRGTRAYMAPERFFGSAASIGTDVYELGVLLYMMLVGQAPWASEDAASRLHPRDPSELGVILSESLTTAVLKSLSTRPEVRPTSAAAFAEAVRDAGIAPPPVADVVTAPSSRPSRPRSKRPFALVAGAVSGLLAVGALVFATRRPEPRRLAPDVHEPSVTSVASAPPASANTTALPVTSASALPVETARPKLQPTTAPRPARPAVASAAASVSTPPAPPTASTSASDRMYGDRK